MWMEDNKITQSFTFEQSIFKKDNILMNQKSRQTVKNPIEKYFYKLLNNTNFRYDCRNNLDNCKFEPIYDEIGEITYIRKYHNLFDNKVSKFVNPSLIEKEIEKTYNKKLLQIKDDDPFISKIEYLKTEKKNGEALRQLKQKEKNTHKKKTIKTFEKRLDEVNKNPKIKSIIDFDEGNSNS